MMLKQTNNLQLFDKQFSFICERNAELRCPKCKNEYTYFSKRDGTGPAFSRPFILDCRHNVCELCIYRNRKDLICPICSSRVQCKQKIRSVFNIRKNFELNVYLFGELYDAKGYTVASNIESPFLIAGGGVDDIAQLCDECETSPRFGFCRLCASKYCQSCFDKVHAHSRILRTHVLRNFNDNLNDDSLNVRPQKCQRHGRLCKFYCVKCRLICCDLCSQADHQAHLVEKLVKENDRQKDEIMKILDSIKVTSESLKKAQQSIKFSGKQWEDYASQTCNDINKYFTELHTFLQCEKKLILDELKIACKEPQNLIQNANNTLEKSENILKKMRTILESYINNMPHYISISDVINLHYKQLENLQVDVKYTKITKNPFYFNIKRDLLSEFRKFFEFGYEAPEFYIDIQSPYGECIPTMPMDIDVTLPGAPPSIVLSNCSPQNKKVPEQQQSSEQCSNNNESTSDMKAKKHRQANVLLNAAPKDTPIIPAKPIKLPTNALVRICHIESPTDFYIQFENDAKVIRTIADKYSTITDDIASKPTTIKLDEMYMVYNGSDKIWYRGRINKKLSNKIYKINLVDFGMDIIVGRKFIIDIDDEDRKVPFAAKRCAIHGIKPVDGAWTKDASNFLCAVTKNETLRINILNQYAANIWKIDLITIDNEHPISVHESFLYTGMALSDSDVKLSPLATKALRIEKQALYRDDVFGVKMLHIEDPLEFYAIKTENVDVKNLMLEKLNSEFEENDELARNVIYAAALQTCCACKHNNKWHRATIAEVMEDGNICVRFVDEGSMLTVNWSQLCYLPSTFRQIKEFAIKCALADIEPLQINDYAWPEEAQTEFRHFVANPAIQMVILSAKNYEYHVSLFINKPHLSVNVGGMLVKHNFAISTGDSTSTVDVYKIEVQHTKQIKSTATREENRTPVQANNMHDQGTASNWVKKIKRTAVDVLHFVSPGEFYVQLHTMKVGIKKFHQQIQVALGTGVKFDNNDAAFVWKINDHCFVYTKFQTLQRKQPTHASQVEDFEWYRGIVTAVNTDKTYGVYLRDTGATIPNVMAKQLRAITNAWDKIANAATRCHLGCLEPTGGLTNWSNSAIDYFKHNLISYEGLSVTMQGKRNPITFSIPVIMWGTIINTTDPLAPAITKYANINRLLVMHGLAHLAERLDFNMEMSKLLEIELDFDEITIENWSKNFETNAGLQAVDMDCSSEKDELDASNYVNQADDVAPYSSVDELLKDVDDEWTILTTPVPAAWLQSKSIEKSQFSGYTTYVDDSCFLYIQEYNHRQLIQNMCKVLEQNYAKYRTSLVGNSIKYGIDQPCLALFHLDNSYYRAIVKQYNPTEGQYDVYFVDFGNIEQCGEHELLPFAPFKRLPALCTKYRLQSVTPTEHEKKSNELDLDILHRMIVDKLVSVNVDLTNETDLIKECSLRLNGMNVVDELAIRGYGKSLSEASGVSQKEYTTSTNYRKGKKFEVRSKNALDTTAMVVTMQEVNDQDVAPHAYTPELLGFDQIDSLVYNMNENRNKTEISFSIDNKTSVITDPGRTSLTQVSRKKPLFDLSEYQELQLSADGNESQMPQSQLAKTAFGDLFVDEVNYDDADIIELEQTFSMNWQKDELDDITKVSNQIDERMWADNMFEAKQTAMLDNECEFHPNDSSTMISHYTGLSTIRENILPTAVKSFHCDVVAVASPTTVHIFPHLIELDFRFQDLQRSIQYEVLSNRAEPLLSFQPNTICLACYSKDKQWYRATIRSYNPIMQQADVLYLDYLNIETLPIDQLRQCPFNFINNWPGRTMKVHLAELKPNPEMHQQKIRVALEKLLLKRTHYAYVIQNDTPNDPTSVDVSMESTEKIITIVLFKDEKTKVPVYQSLIDNLWYLPFES